MKIIPSIDLLDGKCVRLLKGNYDEVTSYYEDPIEALYMLQNMGAKQIHIVDLNGSRNGNSSNLSVIEALVNASQVPIQVGGGIRTLMDVERLLQIGVSYVVIGSLLFSDPSEFEKIKANYLDKIIVSLDVKDEIIRTAGWENSTGVDLVDMLKMEIMKGIQTVLVTDIKVDGTLSGPNIPLMEKLSKIEGYHFIASGGVSEEADLKILAQLNLYGAIVGKAIYEGRITDLEGIC